ncbi:MAG: hypothetical protein AAFY71_12800, partial [Bacteroidota bacterium]
TTKELSITVWAIPTLKPKRNTHALLVLLPSIVHMFKILHIVIACVFLFGFKVGMAQTVMLNSFVVTADGADIMVAWDVQDEAGVAEYRIFRKFEDESTLTHVSTIPNSSQGYYTYLDSDIFKQQPRVLHYELQVVVNGKIQTFKTSLIHNPTSIQRTWGSIKSMFRD